LRHHNTTTTPPTITNRHAVYVATRQRDAERGVFVRKAHTFVHSRPSRYRWNVGVNSRNLLLRDVFANNPNVITYPSREAAAAARAGEVMMVRRGAWVNCAAAADAGYVTMLINTAVHDDEVTNCVFKWNYRRGTVAVYATEDIAAGDELYARYDANGSIARRIRTRTHDVQQ
jgi:hypothetical protein